MKSFAVLISSLLLSSAFLAVGAYAGDGIEANNYDIGIAGVSADSSETVSIGAQARFSLLQYFGLVFRAATGQPIGEDEIGTSGYSASAGLFYRKSDLGHILLEYGYSDNETEATFGGDTITTDSQTDSISLLVRAYLDDFDLSFSASKADFDSRATGILQPPSPIFGAPIVIDERFSASAEVYTAGGAYYLWDNLVVSVLSGFGDGEGSTGFSMSYQPEIWNNNISFSGNYSSTDLFDSYGVSATYYFNSPVSIQERNRSY